MCSTGCFMDSYLMSELSKGISLNTLANKYCNGNKLKVGELIKNNQNNGVIINKRVDSKGTIIYYLGNYAQQQEFIIDNTSDIVKALIISDIHIGRKGDGLIYMDKVYDYASKNDIHIIYVLGDLFDGTKNNARYSSLEVQTKLFLDKYPFSHDIVNYVLLGNHDYSFLHYMSVDVSKIIDVRPDVINLGYGIGKVKLGNDLLAFHHDLVFTAPQTEFKDYKILFAGHSHKFEIDDNKVIVPALARGDFYDNITSTGFLEANFILERNNIKQCILKHFDFIPDVRLINEVYMNEMKSKVKKKI